MLFLEAVKLWTPMTVSRKSKLKQSHSANAKVGMGDSYGTGYKNPIGKPLSTNVGIKPTSKNALKKAPKSLA